MKNISLKINFRTLVDKHNTGQYDVTDVFLLFFKILYLSRFYEMLETIYVTALFISRPKFHTVIYCTWSNFKHKDGVKSVNICIYDTM